MDDVVQHGLCMDEGRLPYGAARTIQEEREKGKEELGSLLSAVRDRRLPSIAIDRTASS